MADGPRTARAAKRPRATSSGILSRLLIRTGFVSLEDAEEADLGVMPTGRSMRRIASLASICVGSNAMMILEVAASPFSTSGILEISQIFFSVRRSI